MDFEPTPQTRETIDRFREFVAEELEPSEAETLAAPFYSIQPVLDALRDKARERGLWGPNLPVELGGMGLGLVDHGLVSEVLGGYPYGHYVCGCQAPDAGNIEILHGHGTAQQKEAYLVPVAAGRMRSCFAMTEPGLPGSNPTLLGTTAVLEGDEYVLNGHKWYATAADGAEVAVVMAITSPDASKYQRASMILVPTDTPGFELVRNISVMGHAGEGWPSHGEIRLADCRVPVSYRLGPEGAGFAIAQERLGPGRIHHCMRWLGICQRMFDLMCRYAVSRQIAPDQRLADRDIVRTWIAECAAEIRAARLLTLQTAWLVERDGWRAARQDISAIKFLVADVMTRVIDRALQVHGSLGMSDDTPIAWFYREERASRIYDGPDEVHKISLAKRILRDYE
jgi:alkylation response protein AidB-like acyl-CoA dehydrogenase